MFEVIQELFRAPFNFFVYVLEQIPFFPVNAKIIFMGVLTGHFITRGEKHPKRFLLWSLIVLVFYSTIKFWAQR